VQLAEGDEAQSGVGAPNRDAPESDVGSDAPPRLSAIKGQKETLGGPRFSRKPEKCLSAASFTPGKISLREHHCKEAPL
ncbi:hypothetical protein KUCAC02_036179, partial [Chaenocephalus aceratus]